MLYGLVNEFLSRHSGHGCPGTDYHSPGEQRVRPQPLLQRQLNLNAGAYGTAIMELCAVMWYSVGRLHLTRFDHNLAIYLPGSGIRTV